MHTSNKLYTFALGNQTMNKIMKKKIFGKTLEIVSENEKEITILYGDKSYIFKKVGEFDATTRYIYLGNNYYEDIPFHVTDGYALCNAEYGVCKTVDEDGNEVDCDDNDVIEVSFPFMRDILMDEKLILDALAYYIDLSAISDEDAFESYLNSTWAKDVSTFFEGFFFFGCDGIEWKVNGVVVED